MSPASAVGVAKVRVGFSIPPSFPYGGMENPTLTFATPTALAGDKSLVSLIAHELAHSWSGESATNATWNDFWLNEGFTTYIESRIMEELRGKKYAGFLDRVSQILPAEQPQHVGVFLSAKLLHDSWFDVGREPFIEPEIIPGGVGHEIARPRVRQLVRDEADE